MKATLVSLFAVMYGVAVLEGGRLDSKDRWSGMISVDEVKRILRDGAHGAMDQVQRDKKDSDVTIHRRDGGHSAMDQVQRDKKDSDVTIQRRHASTPVHSQGLVTDKSNTRTLTLADQECGLQETVVKLAQPVASWYYPSAVKLFRCMGSSRFVSPRVQYCAVTHQQQLTVSVYEITPNGVPSVTTRNVMNHTGCDLDCVVQPGDCRPGSESFNSLTCSCDCLDDASVCNSTFQNWDASNCVCKCKYPATSCSAGEEWNADPNVCACDVKAPDIMCPAGESLDMTTCTCEASVTASNTA